MVGYGTNNIDRFILKVIASPNPPYKTDNCKENGGLRREQYRSFYP
jgi:hypothetical protein